MMVLGSLAFLAKLRNKYLTPLPLLRRDSEHCQVSRESTHLGEYPPGAEEGTEFITGRHKGAPVLSVTQRIV